MCVCGSYKSMIAMVQVRVEAACSGRTNGFGSALQELSMMSIHSDFDVTPNSVCIAIAAAQVTLPTPFDPESLTFQLSHAAHT